MKESQEEILEAVWVAEENGNPALDAIRKRCPISFTDSELTELANQGLLHLDLDAPRLTAPGREVARGIIRRHRLAEVLLSSILKLKGPDMEEIACRVEHSLLPEVEESICTLLGHPDTCPDGKPIPQGKCCAAGHGISGNLVTSLDELAPGEQGKITFIKPLNHDNFHRLLSFGLQPGVTVTVHRKSPAFCLKFENTELALDREIARNIFVWKIGGGSKK